MIVNGRIDRPGDWDVFRFEGRAGQQIVAEVCARRLESPLDSVLELTDAAGKRLAFNDDYRRQGRRPAHAPRRFADRFTLPADGTYYVRLGDAQHQGGPEYAYRLRISAPRPDFELRVVPSCINASPGGSTPSPCSPCARTGFPARSRWVSRTPRRALSLNGGVVPAGQDRVRVTLAVAPMLLGRAGQACGWKAGP